MSRLFHGVQAVFVIFDNVGLSQPEWYSRNEAKTGTSLLIVINLEESFAKDHDEVSPLVIKWAKSMKVLSACIVTLRNVEATLNVVFDEKFVPTRWKDLVANVDSKCVCVCVCACVCACVRVCARVCARVCKCISTTTLSSLSSQ